MQILTPHCLLNPPLPTQTSSVSPTIFQTSSAPLPFFGICHKRVAYLRINVRVLVSSFTQLMIIEYTFCSRHHAGGHETVSQHPLYCGAKTLVEGSMQETTTPSLRVPNVNGPQFPHSGSSTLASAVFSVFCNPYF